MTLPANSARGEVAVRIGRLDVVLAATMEAISQVSSATGYPPLAELCRRMTSGEPATCRAALRAFVIAGEDESGSRLKRDRAAAAAVAAFRLADAGSLAEALAATLAPLFSETPGEGESDQGNGSSVQDRPTRP